MHVETVGSGDRPALIVHGNALAAPFYRPLAEALAERGFATRLVTLPGFHREPPLARPSWAGLADALLDVLDAPDTTLVGHSMGGLLALMVAARRPRLVGRLALLEPAIFPSRALARAASRSYLANVVRGERERFANWNGAMRRVADPARFPARMIELYLEVRRTSDRATGEALFATLPTLYPLPYAEVAVPTLLVTGAASGWRAHAMARWVALRLGARRAVVPDAAHWLANERDRDVAERLASFVG